MLRVGLTPRITDGINSIWKSTLRSLSACRDLMDGSTDCGTGI